MDIKKLLKTTKDDKKNSESKLDPEHLINLRKQEINRIIAASYDDQGQVLPEKTHEQLLQEAKDKKRRFWLNIIYIGVILLTITLLLLVSYAIGKFAS
ncbi:hypothetical protein [Mycoplasmopsis columboralis]|uniref:Uncharacterized protein n=1 Tax=Mycoplasmopsis columboralis TaxID=171282 RepID=A0A449B6P2_9BACT|nr:hypothetical protein [Mycoplasmopsis columboralis]VEU76178.1 Uncharacterised protein [Mycoplasmopsis columboralis]